jgi:hypothetical protein
MSTSLFWVGSVQDTTRPTRRDHVSQVHDEPTSSGETYTVYKGQHKFQRQFKQLEAHTCADKPLWIMLLF